MQSRRKNLSFKLPLFILSISLIPLLILGLLATRYTTRAFTGTETHAIRRTAGQAAERIEHIIVDNLVILSNTAENLSFSELDPAMLRQGLLTLLRQSPEMIQASLLDTHGREKMKVALNQTYAVNDFTDRHSESGFQQALVGSPDVSPVTRLTNGGYSFSLSVPLNNRVTGKLEAVLVADYSPNQLLDVVTNIKIGGEGRVYVVDMRGEMIAVHDTADNNLSPRPLTAALANISQDGSSRTYINNNGTEVLGVIVPVVRTGWQVVAERPFSEIEATSHQIRQISLYIFAAVLLMVAAISSYFVLRITRPLKSLELGAIAIGDGRFGQPINVSTQDEVGRVASAFNLMSEKLRAFAERDTHENWLKDNLSALVNEIRGEVQLTELSNKAIVQLAKSLGAPVGALFVKNSDGDGFSFTAGYAYSPGKSQTGIIVPGQGVLGQCLQEKKLIELTNLPADYLPITSGLGSAQPATILVAPLIHNDQVRAIVEFGTFEHFDPQHKELLNLVSMPLAVALVTVQSAQKLATALIESQQFSEELQAQQEDLRVANEELEDQAQQLKASEEQLRLQQEELQVANEELEEKTEALGDQKLRLTEKNLELQNTQSQLEQQAVEVGQASRYKSEFLANMSHELRTPLNSLLILSQDLAQNRKGNLHPDQVESAEIVYNSGSDLLKLINEILDLAKIEAGKMELSVDKVTIADIIDRLERNFRHIAKDRQLDLIITSDPSLPLTIKTDPSRLDQILKNLVSNALKFTEQGSISINFAPAVQPKGAIIIAVTDTGIGIPKENLQDIFKAFQQIDGSNSRKFNGTGLGLSISRELTQLIGGELTVTSQPGVGSTFILMLPPAVERTATQTEPSERQPLQRTEKACPQANLSVPALRDERDSLRTGDKTILIIEDDLGFAKILADLCQKRGFKFLHASDGESGLELVYKFTPAAIILDIRLPGIQGMEVLDAIKANPKVRHIPVHIISADENTGEAFHHGAIGYLQKPTDMHQLSQTFNKFEEVISGKIRNLLIIEKNPEQQKSIQTLIGNGDVRTLIAATGKRALQVIGKEQIDCIILDLNLADMAGLEFLKQLEIKKPGAMPPIIIYSAQDLTREEVDNLHEYTQSIIIQGEASPARLLDEASLFLHRVVSKLPEHKQKMINELYDQDNLFLGKTILVTDDDMRNIFAIAKVLEDNGAQVLKAANGQKALDLLAGTANIDMVLMDIMMPVMDGLEAIKRIRAQAQFARLPIIALTAKAMDTDRKNCIAAGASDYMSKPVDINRLLSLLRVWMYRS